MQRNKISKVEGDIFGVKVMRNAKAAVKLRSFEHQNLKYMEKLKHLSRS